MFALAHLWMLATALVLDAAVGDPDAIWRRIPHPAVLLGRLVDVLDRGMNRPRFGPRLRKTFGVVAIFVVTAVPAAIGFALEFVFSLIPYGWIGTVLVAAILLAGRSLYTHVHAVAREI